MVEMCVAGDFETTRRQPIQSYRLSFTLENIAFERMLHDFVSL